MRKVGRMERAKRRELVSAVQVAKALQVKPETVRIWSRTGRIPVLRLTRKVIRYDLGAVLTALADANLRAELDQ